MLRLPLALVMLRTPGVDGRGRVAEVRMVNRANSRSESELQALLDREILKTEKFTVSERGHAAGCGRRSIGEVVGIRIQIRDGESSRSTAADQVPAPQLEVAE